MNEMKQLVTDITNAHREACGAARTALDHARKAGELLLKAKSRTAHGGWLLWLTSNFDFTPRTAQSYMRIAEGWAALQAKSETASHLSLREALALLAPAKEYEIHEYGKILPPMTEEEFEALKADINKNGLLEKITLLDGQILDGKERYRACIAVGVAPEFENFEDRADAGDPIDFIVSMNVTRQHFSPSQKAAIAASLTA
jgi:hypothetical protein